MKIGTLTFSYSSNPGSVLQAYALQETILGIEGVQKCNIINYQKTQADKPIFGKNVFCGPVYKWTPGKVAGWIRRMIAYPVRMRKYELFFRDYYRDFAQKPYSRSQLLKLQDEYDRFVVGSDQVWNLDSISVDYTYFLDFVNDCSKKVSYAASFGQKGIPERESEKAGKLISEFSAISVREQDGISTVKDIADRDAEWVLDPSLLRTKEQWESIAVKPAEKDYVFVYLREDSPKIDAFAARLAKEKGLQIVKIITHWKCSNNGKRSSAVGPREWLGYMFDASYVVTNSFHGICFSIALEKQMFVDLLKGNRADTNPRLASLMNLFGLNGRCIADDISLTDTALVDYESVNAVLSQWREKSIGYLEYAIKGE